MMNKNSICPNCNKKGYFRFYEKSNKWMCLYCGEEYTPDGIHIEKTPQFYFICPQCGKTYLYTIFEHHKCKFCGYLSMIQTEYNGKTIESFIKDYPPSKMKALNELLREKYTLNSKYFNEEKYKQLILQERENAIKNDDEKEELEFQQRQQRLVEESNKPHCPTCGSTNIRKIPTSKKISGGFMFGLFSSNVRKTFECLNCKYKW